MPVDNSDYLDPDAFSSPIATDDAARYVELDLTLKEDLRLNLMLHQQAQRYELQASNREAQLVGTNAERAPGVLAKRLRDRADVSRSLLNKYRQSGGMKPMTPAEILDW